MKIKFVYQNGPFYYEAECLSETERKEAIKGLIYASKDLFEANMLGYDETCQGEPVLIETEQNNKKPKNTIEYASEGQKKYMDKLGIPYTSATTKIEAIDLINAWKTSNGIPISGKNSQ